MALALLLGGCAASSPHGPKGQDAPARRRVKIHAEIHGEGNAVAVAGQVAGLPATPALSHVDFAVYAADGELLLATSAAYVVASTGEPATAGFRKLLPNLRGRKIGLRVAHHGGVLPGSGVCPNNAALARPTRRAPVSPQPRIHREPALGPTAVPFAGTANTTVPAPAIDGGSPPPPGPPLTKHYR